MTQLINAIVALLVLIVVSAPGAHMLVPLISAGPGLQVLLPSAHAQDVGKSQGHVPQAPVGHRQPTAQGAENVRENSSASDATRKADERLKKKLQGICRGC
jgi:hypothetical protein